MATKKNDSAKKAGGAVAKKATSGKTASNKTASAGVKEKSLTELISALAETTGITKAKAKEVLDAHAELLISELKETGSVQLAGIGKLKLGKAVEGVGSDVDDPDEVPDDATAFDMRGVEFGHHGNDV